jgi:hypothetical protein
MRIPTPRRDRIPVINAVLANDMDPSVLSDTEMTWLEDLMMERFVAKLAETNPMVFFGDSSTVLQ